MNKLVERVYCNRCGTAVHALADGREVAKSDYYCAECADRSDAGYRTGNLCSACNKTMHSTEAKFVMPSSILGHRPQPRSERLMCTACYKRFALRSRNKTMQISAASLAQRRFIQSRLMVKSILL